ncbi:MAG TPA: class F sortase [Microbacteriaceae bacterium]|nr:class F sortase [Microbacteriaceae bacterium]
MAVGLAAIGTAAIKGSEPRASAATSMSMNHKPVTLDPGEGVAPKTPSPPPGQTHAPNASPRPKAGRLVVPSVGLSVPLGTMRETDGEITPPGFTSAYQIDNLGVTPSNGRDGTVFVAMHSLRGGAIGPGNYLTDVAKGVAKVAIGALVEVDGVDYRITGWARVKKADLPYLPFVWNDTPNRLVMITCLELPSGAPSVDNMVLTAERD